MIEACAEHFREPLQLVRDDHPEAAGTEARFVLTILPHIPTLPMPDLNVMQRALDRERLARKDAEALLEQKSRELFQANVELKTMADALREQNKRTQAILDTAAEGIITISQTGIVESYNPAAEKIFGYPAAEVVGQNISLLMPSPHREQHDDYLRRYLSAGQSKIIGMEREVMGRRKDGTNFPIEVSISELRLGERYIFTGIVRDVTRRKELEQRLALSQKMESVGQLAAGIAHELNTPIQYVNDNSHFLLTAVDDIESLLRAYEQLERTCREGRDPASHLACLQELKANEDVAFAREEMTKAVEHTLEGSQRVARIVQAMRDFSHPGTREKQLVDLNRAIQSTVVVSRNEWKYVAELVLELDPNLPFVPCLSNEFNQTLLNLIVNAAHAIADKNPQQATEKGRITISTRVVEGHVEVRVSDTGTGIAPEVRCRVFDPFFTTKPVGQGTGQGLAIVYSSIVEKHQGSIDCETELGHGSTFIIRLPLNEPPGDASPANTASEHEKKRTLC